MSDPIKWDSKILLAKVETTYGTDSTPTGTANGILATDVSLTPMEGNDLSRALETPYLGAQPTIPVELHAKISFKVELAGSGTAGTAPAWGPLLRACAVAQTIVASTSVTYNPVSDAHEAVTLYLWIGGTLYRIRGTRGNCKFTVSAQGIPYLEFELTGLFAAPAETARDMPTLTGFKKPLPGTTANTPVFTIDGTGFVMRTFMMDLGNQVETSFLIGDEAVLITDKGESIQTTVRAAPLTTFDPFALALAQTAVPVVLTHGTVGGNIATLTVSDAQMQRLQGLSNAQKILEWPLRMVPLPTAGNDQWTLTLT